MAKEKGSTRAGGDIVHVSTRETKSFLENWLNGGKYEATVVDKNGNKAKGNGDTEADAIARATGKLK